MKAIYSLFVLFFVHSTISNAANFSSVSSGTWSAPATWTITSGTDADGVPDQDDDVIINGGHSVTLVLTSNSARSIVNNGDIIGNTKRLNVYGNFTNTGTVSSRFVFYIQAPCVFTSSNVFSGAISWWINKNLTISSGTQILSPNTMTTYTVVSNFGSVSISGGLSMSTSGHWINQANSSLSISANISSNGTLTANALNNTVTYNNSACNQIKSAIYYNLRINKASNVTRVAQGNLTVLNNFTMASGTQLNCFFDLNNYNMSVGGNWDNSANTNVLNQGTVTFNGSGNQLISRSSTEQFSNLVINSTGTVTLNRDINLSGNLNVQSGTLDVSASNFQINLQGNLINNGVINTRAGNINFNGSSPQTVSGSVPIPFYNLTLNNSQGLTFNSPSTLSNALTVSNGNFNSNNNFTLLSNGSSTARIAPVGSGGSFSGTMIIQRHISSRVKSWHDLSSPVVSTNIFDWDNEMYMSGFSTVDNPSGIAGVDGMALDQDGHFFYSVRSYNESTASYALVTNSTTPLSVGRGYEIWLAENMSDWSAKTIDTRGVPNFGNKTINLSFTSNAGGYGGTYDGLNLIGNPFASAVNYSACTKTNMNPGFLVLDNSGNYVDQGANGVIPPYQGIWVQATSAGASIIFNESAKSTSNSSLFHRTAEDYNIRLMFSSPQLEYFHENTINFNLNGTVGFDKELDMVFLKSPNLNAPSMYMLTGEKGGVITNYVSNEMEELTIPLALFTPSAGIYYIEPSILNRNDYKKVWIENIKTGKQFDLLNGNATIEGVEGDTNKDYVLRLSKKEEANTYSQAGFENDLVVFNIENALNLKANHSNHDIQSIEIYDLTGKLVLEYKDIEVLKGSIMSFDISQLNKGIYIVNVLDASNHIINKKIVR